MKTAHIEGLSPMKIARCLRIIRVWLVLLGGLYPNLAVRAVNLDTIGATVLQTVTTNLNGTGVRVGQPEAYDTGTTNWEVNPGASVVEQPASLFTYTSGLGSANTYPNSINAESGHADSVAENFTVSLGASPPMWRTWIITTRIISSKLPKA